MRKKNILWGVLVSLLVLSIVASACGQTETIVETVIVEGTPQVIEKEATLIVEVEKPIELVITATPQPSGISRDLLREPEGPTIITDPSQFPTSFNEAPELAERVAAGELEPVEDRLPVREDLLVYEPLDAIGIYGGIARHGFTGPGDRFGGWRVIAGPDYPLYADAVTAETVPHVLKGWEISEDGRVIDLFLRRGMRWSDGEPVTADDWLFWFEDVYQDPDLGGRPSVAYEPGGEAPIVEKISDFQVRYTFAVPYPYFISLIAESGGPSRPSSTVHGLFQPKHYLMQFHAKYVGEDEANKMAQDAGFENWVALFNNQGTWGNNIELPSISPWIPATSNTGSVWLFKRNPYYWAVDTAGNQLPYLDGWEHTLASNLEVLNLKAVAGEYDFQSRHLDVRKLPLFLQYQQEAGYKIYLDPSEIGAEVGMEVNQNYDLDAEIGKWLQNTDFRRALSLGIDREQVNQAFFLGLGFGGSAAPAPTNRYYPGDEYRTLWSTYDPDSANSMLDSIGLDVKDSEGYRLRTDNGQRLVLEAVTVSGQSKPFTEIMEMIAEQWKEIGIYVDIRELDRSLVDNMIPSGEIQLRIWDNVGTETIVSQSYRALPTNANNANFGRLYSAWFVSGGTEGLEPPPRMKEAMEMVNNAFQAPEEEQIRLGKEIWKICLDEVYMIAVVGQAPGFYGLHLVNEGLGNVPERILNANYLSNPLIARPDTWYFKNDE